MLNQKIRDRWDRFMRPIGASIGRSGISPNAVTVLGLAVQCVVAYLIVADRLVAAGTVAVLSAVLDGLDGAVAKARGRISRFGALLDSTLDRAADALIFLPIAWLYLAAEDGPRAGEEWVAAIALVTLVLSFLVSYVKARAEGLGFTCDVGLVERAERLIVMILALWFNALLPIALIGLGALSLVTLVQRMVHVRKQAVGGT